MPLPLLFIAVAAATGLLGAGKTVKAVVDTHDAKKNNEKANDIVDAARSNLEKHRSRCGNNLKNLGRKKIMILNSSINDFINAFGRLKNVDFKESTGLNEMDRLCIDSKDFDDLKGLGDFASSVIGGVVGGTLGGALTAFGAYSAAGTLAAASTGTAISTLSGAAATNATLAFFGGGSLAAGGLGIAGGTMVLGGLVAGPALAIMGFIVGAKASKAKDEAYSNLAKAKKISEELSVASDLCDAISTKCGMFISLLKKLDEYFKPMISKIQEAINEHGTDYTLFSREQKQATAAAASLAKAIKTVLDTPIIDADGNITNESNYVLKRIKPDEIVLGACSASKCKKQSNILKELSIKDIVAKCKYNVEYRPGLYDDEDEYANINLDRLTEFMNYSYGLEATKEEYASIILDYSSEDKYSIHSLEWNLQRFVETCQIAIIVEECTIHISNALKIEDIDWDKLIYKIKIIYKVKMEKWQLFTPGKNTMEKVMSRIHDAIRYLQVPTIFVNSEFQRLNKL